MIKNIGTNLNTEFQAVYFSMKIFDIWEKHINKFIASKSFKNDSKKKVQLWTLRNTCN